MLILWLDNHVRPSRKPGDRTIRHSSPQGQLRADVEPETQNQQKTNPSETKK